MSGTTLPPSTINGAQSAVRPLEHIQYLEFTLGTSLTSDEMAFVMHMFPSLHGFDLYVNPYEEDDVSHRYDMQVVAQFLKYLSLIPLVDYRISFGTAQSLASIARLVTPVDVKSLSLHYSAHEPDTALRLLSKSLFMKAPPTGITKTNGFDVHIRVLASEAQALLDSVLEDFNGRAMESFSIGSSEDSFDIPQKFTQQYIDSLLDIDTQQLVFVCAEFPLHVPLSQTRKPKHLASLRLVNCKITESYFTWISCQFEQIDDFEFSYDYELERNTDKKIRIPLLCTTLDKLFLKIYGLESFIVRVCVNCRCITLKATFSRQTPYTFEEYEETESLIDGYEAIVYCAGLKEIHYENAVYKLP
ncbi:hypothetical protein FB192DRAFT_1397069 [Mucor lusitanicus]|uniref:Uncharacterized protein n=2 Tax=Mucor circinelloides f. lusitanicus TaxID=29924 RepID=A0A168NZ88_MUCCL|nr:hypothetical protein FB192DRAFT_1397069 [Mucor lusitanicus]OAD06937.1 hypothetical protein MUCCIDRAFT_107534 [Mucor lusitanicus CBS 277.49]